MVGTGELVIWRVDTEFEPNEKVVAGVCVEVRGGPNENTGTVGAGELVDPHANPEFEPNERVSCVGTAGAPNEKAGFSNENVLCCVEIGVV